jgi:hypothetical protein
VVAAIAGAVVYRRDLLRRRTAPGTA